MTTAGEDDSDRTRWVILTVLCLARTSMGFQFQSIASVSGDLVREMGFSYAEIGTLIGLYMLPGIVVALPGGALMAKFGDKSLAVFGLALMVTGDALAAAVATPDMLFIGRTISGAGGVVFNVVVTKMVSDWFAGREIVTAMALTAATWPLGVALGLMGHGALAAAAGWPSVLAATAGFAAIALILVASRYRTPLRASAAGSTAIRYRLPGREFVLVTLAGLMWTFLNVGLTHYFSFAPGLLVALGRDTQDAAHMVSLGLWMSLIAIPLGGYLTERFNRPNAAILIFCLTSAMSMFLMPFWTVTVALCLLIGIGIGPPAGVIMAFPAEVLRPENRAAGLGVFFTWYYAGMAAGPPIAGLGRDLTASAATPVLIGGVFFATGALILVPFRWLQSNWAK
jgi:MFS family permease